MHTNNRNILMILAAGVLACGTALAQDAAKSTDNPNEAVEQKSVTKHKGPGKNTKMKSHTVTGTVKEYEAGKDIEITTAKNNDEKFDLSDKDTTATVSPDVAVGKKVKAVQTTDDNGHKTLTVDVQASKMHHHKKAAK